MRVRITGADRDSGERTRLEVDAVDVKSAVAEARGEGIEIAAVSVLRNGQWIDQKPVQAGQPRSQPKPQKSSCAPLVLMVLLLACSPMFPAVGAGAATLIALMVLLLLVPALRGKMRSLLRLPADRPVARAFKVTVILVYAGVLGLASWGGIEAKKMLAEQERLEAAANHRVQELLQQADVLLQNGEVEEARGILVQAADTPDASELVRVEDTLARIELATDADLVRSRLSALSDDEFQSFADEGVTPASLVLGYAALTEKVVALARSELPAATTAREERARQQAEKEEKRRQERAERSAALAEERRRKREEAEKERAGHPMGTTVHVGYTSYCVWKAHWSNRLSSNQFLDRSPNASFLFVDLTVRNNDKKARTIPPFYLLDENDARYDADSAATMLEGSIGLIEDLNPGVSKQGLVVFDVPRNHTYRLKVDGGFWSSETALIQIQPTEGD